MGTRGPKPTPTSILKLRGGRDYWRVKDREGEPKAISAPPKCPRDLTPDARKMWRKLVKQLSTMRVLAETDANALERYCRTFVVWRRAIQEVDSRPIVTEQQGDGGMYSTLNVALRAIQSLGSQLDRLEDRFGLSPSARTALRAERPATTGDLAEFLAKQA